MVLESADQFERTRLSIAGYGVTVTSWYDVARKHWRANAPAWAHLLLAAEEPVTGASREKALLAVERLLANRLPEPAPPGRR